MSLDKSIKYGKSIEKNIMVQKHLIKIVDVMEVANIVSRIGYIRI